MRRAIAIALFLCACGSDPAPAVDAAPAGPDAASCTGAVYDPCTDGTQCMSGMCHLYMKDMITVCTTSCSASLPCPTFNGQAVACNNNGNCKPPAPNACTR